MTFDEMRTAAVHVMDKVNVPKWVFDDCSAVIFVKANEVGLVFSGTDGAGLIFKRTGSGWSQPAAFKLQGVGIGGVIGFAERDTVITLNRNAADRFLENDFKLNLSLDLGAAMGSVGGAGDVGVGVSDKGGLASSMVYSYQKGALINLELAETSLVNYHEANFQMYGTDLVKNILDGTAKAKDPAKVEELISKVVVFTGNKGSYDPEPNYNLKRED